MDPLTPLDRELTASLRVDPSPAFVARVRVRVAADPIDPRWHVPSLVFATGALAVVLYAAIVLVPPVAPPAEPSAGALLPQRSSVILAPLRTGLAPHRTAFAMSPRSSSPARVMVSASEMAALRQLFSGAVVAPELPEASGQELVIPEISIEPIVLSSNPEGAGQ
jgi:hypothetical protein